jgi:glycosyltransferase involved in cell wall biosynthesis
MRGGYKPFNHFASLKRTHRRGTMNIGMVTYSVYEQDSRVMRYAETLVEEGHQVEVISLKQNDKPLQQMVQGVRVLYIQRRNRNEKGCMGYVSKMIVFFTHAFLILSVRHLFKRYDLIHAHSIPDFAVFTAIIPRLTGAHVILDIHDLLPELFMSRFGSTWNSLCIRLLRLAEKASCFVSHHVIIANDIWREKLTQRSVLPSRCTTLLNYPDKRFYFDAEVTREVGRVPIALYPGTLSNHQGLDIALKAVALLSRRNVKVALHIYGEGLEEQNLLSLRKELGIENEVQIHGMLALDSIVDVMRTATIGVVPKRAEGFGNEAFSTKTFEFLALGVPVAVSATAVDKRYFNDDVVEFFESGNPESMAAAMQRLLTDENLYQQRRANGLAFMELNHWDVKRQIYLGIIQKLTKGRK